MSESKSIRSFRGSYRYLSNFFLSEVVLSYREGSTRRVFRMPSVENAYQAAKVSPKLPNRTEIVEGFVSLSAAKAKSLGRSTPRASATSSSRFARLRRRSRSSNVSPRSAPESATARVQQRSSAR